MQTKAHGNSLTLAKLVRNQRQDGIRRLILALAAGVDDDFAAYACRQHHHAHDAFGVDAALATLHPDFASERSGKLRQFGRRPCMEAKFVDDFGFDSGHDESVSAHVDHTITPAADGAGDEGFHVFVAIGERTQQHG